MNTADGLGEMDMERWIHWQRWIYGLVVVLVLSVVHAGGSVAGDASVALSVGLIFLFGMPHGAMDTLIAQKIFRIDSAVRWLVFILLYLLFAGCIFWLWVLAPLGFLILFFLVSAAHFSGDLHSAVPLIIRLVYGGVPLVLGTLLFSVEAQHLIGVLAGPEIAMTFTSWLSALAPFWLVASLVSILIVVLRSRRDALDYVLTAVSSMLNPPLAGFTVFFCFMHSPRHAIRSAYFTGLPTFRRLAMYAAIPTAAVGIAAVVAFFFIHVGTRDERLVQVTFVALACLTFPHMLVIHAMKTSSARQRLTP